VQAGLALIVHALEEKAAEKEIGSRLNI